MFICPYFCCHRPITTASGYNDGMPHRTPITPAGRRKPDATHAPGAPAFPHLDPLTQILDDIHLRCMVPGAHEMTAPWGVRFGAGNAQDFRRQLETLGLPLPAHDPPAMQGALVAVLDGNCCLTVEKHRIKLALTTGDVVLITRKDPFILRDTWTSPVREVHELIRREDIEQQRGLRWGHGGARTTFLGGAFHFADEERHPLLASLPPVIHVRSTDLNTTPWLESTLKFLTSELTTHLPGAQSIVNHLVHVLFVQAVRAYAATRPGPAPRSGFQAIFDSELAPVLGHMHSRPEAPWTVASLAAQACISRSAFSARFTATIGSPPLHYLTECRMRKARSLLRNSSLGIKAIAIKVGYSNESAFSNAFKRATGTSPGQYRRAQAKP